MINTLSVLFYIRPEKRNLKGKVPLFCRITLNKERTSFSIKRTVEPDNWCAIREIVLGKYDEAQSINSYINLLKKKIYDAQYKLVDSNTPLSVHTLKMLVLNKERINAKSALQYLENL